MAQCNKTQQIAVKIFEEQFIYLKSKGIDKSKFMRQAIEAHKSKKFEYDYLNKGETK